MLAEQVEKGGATNILNCTVMIMSVLVRNGVGAGQQRPQKQMSLLGQGQGDDSTSTS